MTVVVVAGALANKPGQAGEAWVKLSWIRGLERLGIEVWFVEQLAESMAGDERAPAWFRAVTERFELAKRAALLAAGESIVGPSVDDLVEVAAGATLVNISGHLTFPRLFDAFRRRVLVDIDPGFTQFWHQEGLAAANVEGHDVHFTIGELIGTDGCPIPTGGIEWHPVRQPVVLDDWPVSDTGDAERFTTVATWRGPYGSVEVGGRTYGLKVHEFRKFIELPQRSSRAVRDRAGYPPWRRSGSARPAGSRLGGGRPASGSGRSGCAARLHTGLGRRVLGRPGYVRRYRLRLVQRSQRCATWLRGRPVLVQDTGFSRILPVGEGLLAFRTLEEAVAGADEIASRYSEHCAAAREIAEGYFDSERVLARFCEQAGIG